MILNNNIKKNKPEYQLFFLYYLIFFFIYNQKESLNRLIIFLDNYKINEIIYINKIIKLGNIFKINKYKNYIFILNTFVGILIIFSKYAIMIGISLVKRKFRIFHYVSWLYGDQDSMDEVVYYDKSYREINGVVHCFSKSNNE